MKGNFLFDGLLILLKSIKRNVMYILENLKKITFFLFNCLLFIIIIVTSHSYLQLLQVSFSEQSAIFFLLFNSLISLLCSSLKIKLYWKLIIISFLSRIPQFCCMLFNYLRYLCCSSLKSNPYIYTLYINIY